MTDQTPTRQLRFLISSLVLLLVFEGLLRKIAGRDMKVAIFFAKDFNVLLMGFYVLRMPKSAAIEALWKGYSTLLLLFVPAVLATAFKDPLLAVFGAERYLLMPMVAFGIYGAFANAGMEVILSYAKKLGLLLIPTTLLALVQLRLPVNHWVNCSVSGGTLEGFAAAETLRVGSTFPFVSQFVMFLNMQIFACAIALSDFKRMSVAKRIIYGALPFAILLSCYATGSRGAVIGGAAVVGIASLITVLKGHQGGIIKICGLAVLLCIGFFTLREFFPEAFAVYGEREAGRFLTLSSDNKERTLGMFTSLFKGETSVSLFGHGLGVMSNGSEKLSSYAFSWRRSGFWTETDGATTLFEGGIYLMLVWYGFRLWVIVHTTRRVFLGMRGEYRVAAAFCQGYIILQGALGTLGIQPPLAMWWWMAIGISTLLWQKSTAPDGGSGGPPPESEWAGAVPNRKIRGRSAYAEELHKSPRR